MTDILKYKNLLEEEYSKLGKELEKIGEQNKKDPSEWAVKAPDMDISQADENEVGDRSEENQIDSIILDELSVRYNNVALALKKIEKGTYGLCEIDGKQIEEQRLEANPAARTCKEHIGQEIS